MLIKYARAEDALDAIVISSKISNNTTIEVFIFELLDYLEILLQSKYLFIIFFRVILFSNLHQ